MTGALYLDLLTGNGHGMLAGNDTRIGQPASKPSINYPDPIAPVGGERVLAFAGFESLVGGSADDWFDLRDGAGLTGTIDAQGHGDGGDTLHLTGTIKSSGTNTGVRSGASESRKDGQAAGY